MNIRTLDPSNSSFKQDLLHSDANTLRIVAIGVGAAFSNQMFQSNFIVVLGDDVVWLDLGSKTSVKLTEFGLSVHDIKNIVISHLHADHVGGLEELALKRRYEAPFMLSPKEGESPDDKFKRAMAMKIAGAFRPNLYVPRKFADEMWDSSLRGGLAYSEEVELNGTKGHMNLGHYFNLKDVQSVTELVGPEGKQKPKTFYRTYVGKIKLDMFLTKHIPDSADNFDDSMFSVGFRINDKVWISGDTKFDPENVELFGHDCEILMHDCQSFPGGVHAWYKELVTLPDDVKAKMFLYHLNDAMLSIDPTKDGFLDFLKPMPCVYEFDLNNNGN